MNCSNVGVLNHWRVFNKKQEQKKKEKTVWILLW